jgi:hypothetical protein
MKGSCKEVEAKLFGCGGNGLKKRKEKVLCNSLQLAFLAS